MSFFLKSLNAEGATWACSPRLRGTRSLHSVDQQSRFRVTIPGPQPGRAHGMMGLYVVLLGRAEEAEAAVQEALRLSPRDPWAFAWVWSVGMAKSILDRPEEAVVWLRRSLDSNRNYPPTHFCLAAAFAQLGRPHEARSSVNSGLALDQRFTLERFRLSAESDNPIYLARRERLIDRLRQAGVPEA
jgi:tetratricopeptide (TPR) repeat protein